MEGLIVTLCPRYTRLYMKFVNFFQVTTHRAALLRMRTDGRAGGCCLIQSATKRRERTALNQVRGRASPPLVLSEHKTASRAPRRASGLARRVGERARLPPCVTRAPEMDSINSGSSGALGFFVDSLAGFPELTELQ